MLYQALFLINKGTQMVVLTVDTHEQSQPHHEVLAHCDTAVVFKTPEDPMGVREIIPTERGLQVLKDRAGFFRAYEPVDEAKVLAWVRAGRSLLGKTYEDLFKRTGPKG